MARNRSAHIKIHVGGLQDPRANPTVSNPTKNSLGTNGDGLITSDCTYRSTVIWLGTVELWLKNTLIRGPPWYKDLLVQPFHRAKNDHMCMNRKILINILQFIEICLLYFFL